MTKARERRIVVFVGPSLAPESRPPDDMFVWRAPAVAGDAWELAIDSRSAAPAVVVLIDGLFDEWPAVRHKELLSLVARGVTVIGGASMGALRAAELHPYGMIGVGRIFAAYATGRLERDDEVAVLHGPAEFGWAALTEALVNVRATLVKSVRERVLASDQARRIRHIAAASFYKERTWPSLLNAARIDRPSWIADLAGFAAWLPGGRIDLKAIDARACLDEALRRATRTPPRRPEPPATSYVADLAEAVAARIRRDRGCRAPR